MHRPTPVFNFPEKLGAQRRCSANKTDREQWPRGGPSVNAWTRAQGILSHSFAPFGKTQRGRGGEKASKKMEFDPFNDRVLTLPQAAKLLSSITSSGKPPSTSTIWRWHSRGVLPKGTQGARRAREARVRLSIWKVGGRAVTTERALRKFVRLTSSSPNADQHQDNGQETRTKRADAVEQELRRRGL